MPLVNIREHEPEWDRDLKNKTPNFSPSPSFPAVSRSKMFTDDSPYIFLENADPSQYNKLFTKHQILPQWW